ncbi:hypothetical protein Q8A67_023199 [Cirrhinus molitorella]|uniref:HECT domain-containing protein n=1 Tax=Cirrhinus molitorella TaxID=172907 RepID=A0AA88PDI9_9TELE|nr:hypothetical protein Q8A67_023199 [Cirrhinus molitorella]
MNCIRNERERPHTPQHISAQPTATVAVVPTNSRPVRPATLQQEMQRCFPSLYSGGKRKRKSADIPRVSVIKFMEMQFCLQPENTDKTPKDEAVLLQAGLGRRTINLADNVDHGEISRVLLEEYPKMRDLRGGWLLKKASGGSGQRKTTPLPQGTEGYTAKLLRSSSNNGKNDIYIVPLQEKIDTTPLPYDAPEFERMPKNTCMTCGKVVPLPLIQFHIESCGDNKGESEEESEQTVEQTAEQDLDVMCVDSCPICGKQFPAEIVAYHASSCGESFADILSTSTLPDSESLQMVSESNGSASFFSIDSTLHTGPSTSATLSSEDIPLGSGPVQMDDLAWKSIASPELAADHYRRHCLQNKEDEPTLKIKMDIGEDVEEQEGTILNFYKAPNIDWARPFQAKLQGDLAIGDGVNRPFLSMVVLDHIKWPEEGGLEHDDDSGYSTDSKCRVMGYLRQFIRTVSQEQLKQLVKFWVGWEIPMASMKVEVVQAQYPTSSTCFRTLRLPGYYNSFREFSVHLENCIATNDSGFGLL